MSRNGPVGEIYEVIDFAGIMKDEPPLDLWVRSAHFRIHPSSTSVGPMPHDP